MLNRIGLLPAGSVVVVTGDFNAPAEKGATWRAATTRGLVDAWVVANERKGPAFTLSAFGPPFDWDVGRIDWILVCGPITVASVETVFHNDAGRYPSDHYPVAAHLTLD